MDEPVRVSKRIEIDKVSKANKDDSVNEVTFTALQNEVLCDYTIYYIDKIIFNKPELLSTQNLNPNNDYAAIKRFMISVQLAIVDNPIQAIFNSVLEKFTGSLTVNLPSNQISQAQERYNLYQRIFINTYKPERYTIKNIRKQMEYFRDIKYEDFISLLNNAGIVDHHANFIEIKNTLVIFYAKFIEIISNQLAELQKIVPNISIDVLDEFTIQLNQFMHTDAHLLQERRLMGYMRAYAKYPQHRQHLLTLIIRSSKPYPILVGDEILQRRNHSYAKAQYEGMTNRIHLADIAKKLKSEGLLPSYISEYLNHKTHNEVNVEGKEKVKSIHARLLPTEAQLKSFDETIEMFLNADSILGEFSQLSCSYQYENIAEKKTAISKAENILSNAKTVDDYNAAFNLMAPYINRHKHCKWDSFFGNEITKTWNKIMKQIREPAIAALFDEVSRMIYVDNKIKRLKDACEMPLFNQHRNNHWYTGALGDTHAVSIIKKEIANLEEQKKRPKYYVQLSRSVE